MKKRTLTALFAVTALSAAMMAGCAGKAEKEAAPRLRRKKLRLRRKTKKITILEMHLWTTQEIRMRSENRSCW